LSCFRWSLPAPQSDLSHRPLSFQIIIINPIDIDASLHHKESWESAGGPASRQNQWRGKEKKMGIIRRYGLAFKRSVEYHLTTAMIPNFLNMFFRRPVSSDEARRIARNACLPLEEFQVYDDEPPHGCYLYVTRGDEPCWYVTIPTQGLCTGSSRIAIISKRTGKIRSLMETDEWRRWEQGGFRTPYQFGM
jgi:hypothetical protein